MNGLEILLAGAVISVRTMLFGVWNLRHKNVTGGIFILLLAASTLGLAARYYFRS